MVGFPLQADAWPSTSQEMNEHESPSTVKITGGEARARVFKSATLQPMGRSISSDWNSDLEDTINSTTPLQPQKVVKFSASSISLNRVKPTGDSLSKTAESSYV